MITYNEVREMVLAGEGEAVVALLLAHHLVSSVDVQTAEAICCRVGVDDVQLTVQQSGCQRYITISENLDGSPCVDVFVEQAFELTDMDIMISDAFDADRAFYSRMNAFMSMGMPEDEAYEAAIPEGMDIPF